MKNRRDFLRISGLAGAATLLPFSKLLALDNAAVCTLMPSDDEGPFPYPGGEINNPLNIVDVRGGQPGLPLEITFAVTDAATCTPLENVRVDIWSCNADGDYSGYAAFAGQFWLRGFQMTDVNGLAHFTTIYPGWYPGRATHIHMEFFFHNVMKLHSQIAFDESISNAVHVTGVYAAKGINTTTNMQDGILSNTPADLIIETIALTGDTTNGYSGTLNVGLSGIPTSVKENNLEDISIYPGPVSDKLIVHHPVADLSTTVKVLNLQGKVVATGVLKTGSTVTTMDASRIASGAYILVIEKMGKKNIIKFIKD